MKGDFTRLTFRPDKHYTSVRMQQGRLQLDSDWNEQADIQAHFYRTQVVDLIGAASGAPTSENDPTQETDKAYKDSFKISVTSDKKDLVIAPGRFYVSGTLCELEATPVDYALSTSPSNRINVRTLIVDGRKFESGQWVKVSDGNQILQIQEEINTQTLELPLSAPVNQAGRLNRIVTYKTQADYPNPDFKDTIADGLYFAYLDVWQRHITAVEDLGLREVALNIPDTTTRTKTIWQLKLRKLDRSLIQECSLSETEEKNLLQKFNTLIDGFSDDLENFKSIIKGILPTENEKIDKLIVAIQSATTDSEKSLTQQFEQLIASVSETEKSTLTQAFKPLIAKLQADPTTFNADVQDLIQQINQTFLAKDKGRQVVMNACAKLCPASGGATSSDSRYRRLENQLYRVEIHNPGKVGDDQSGAEIKKATFKWSRDNGSIVSIIENDERFEKGIITIRKSAQDAWATSKSGQWIEFLNEERELKGQSGQLARLNRVSGNKIEFDVASLVGDEVPNPTKVRRWDHMTKEASILTRTEWIELEAGIKVQFNKDSEYKTGDYWVIPARAATNDIEWSTDQAEDLNKRQPLPQSALGVEHDYALLAVIAAENGEFLPPQDEEQDKAQDQRFIFPALAYTFDSREGVIKGNLEVRGTLTTNNFNITGKFAANTFQGNAFQIAKNPTTSTPENFGIIQLNNNDIEFKAEPTKNANFKFTDGNVAIAKDLQVSGDVKVDKKTTTESLQVNTDATITQNIQINGNATVAQKTTTESLQVNTDATITQNIQINGNATVAQKTTTESLQVNKNAIVTENVQIDGNATVDKKINTKELQVTTNATITQKTTTEQLQVGTGASIGTTTAGGSVEILGTTASPALLKVNGNATITQKTTTESLQVNSELTLGKAVTGGSLKILGTGSSPGSLEVNGSVRAEILAAKQLATQTIDAETVLIKGSTLSGGYHQISSRALKEDITDLNSQDVTTLLKALSPVRFIYTEDTNKSLNLGFIAEDTPDLLTSPDKQAIKIMDIVAILTKAVKDQQSELEILRERLRVLEERDLDSPPEIVSFSTALDEESVPRSSRSRKRSKWVLYRNLKRLIRRLFNGIL